MTDDLWITVPGWGKFQHYGDRAPVWIKVYLELLDRGDWKSLSFADRGLMVTIWLAYARAHGVLREQDIGAYVGGYATRYGNLRKALERLNHAGFLQLSASKPLAQIREEKEKKEVASKTVKNTDAQKRTRKAQAWLRNVGDQIPDDRLPETLADEFHLELNTARDLIARNQEFHPPWPGGTP